MNFYGVKKEKEVKFAPVTHDRFKEFYAVVDVVSNKGRVKSFLVTQEANSRIEAEAVFTKAAKKLGGTVSTISTFK